MIVFHKFNGHAIIQGNYYWHDFSIDSLRGV